MSTVSLTRPARDCAPRLRDVDAEHGTYHVEVHERFNAVLDIVDAWASDEPDALAVLSVDAVGEVVAEQSVADLARASREAARVLLDLGVSKDDHVFVMLPRVQEWYVDDNGKPAEPGEVGNIVVRCQPERPVGLFPGYHNKAGATAEAFCGRFYFTGGKAGGPGWLLLVRGS